MNYLTNYYKNLSEQLQQKVNLLESYLQQVNEDLEPGTVMQGYGSSTSSTTTNQNDNPDLNNFLQAWGSSDPAYDYNRDGVVDGNDLGIHLSRMLDRGTRPTMMASTVPGTPGTPETAGGRATKRVKPLDQPGTASMPGTTRKTSKTPTRMASTDGQGPSSPGGVGTDDEITGGNNAGGGNPPPPQGPGFSAEPFGPPPALRPKYNYGAGAPIPPAGGGGKPPAGGGGTPPSGGGGTPPSGGGGTPPSGGGGKPPSGGGGGPVTPPPTMPPRRAKVAAPGLPAAAPTAEQGSVGFYDTTMTDIGEPATVRGQTPYWMSSRTTDIDTLFRGMPRKRKG